MLELIKNGKVRKAKKYLHKHNDENVSKYLCHASAFNNIKMVEMLIRKGANVNYYTDEMEAPLYHAIINKQPLIVEYLLNHGAFVNSITYNNYHIHNLYAAFSYRCTEIFKVLLDHGANPDCICHDDIPILWHTVSTWMVEETRMLLERGCNVNFQDKRGVTVFSFVSQSTPLELYCLLLQYGGNPRIVSYRNHSHYPHASILQKRIFKRGEVGTLLMSSGWHKDVVYSLLNFL